MTALLRQRAVLPLQPRTLPEMLCGQVWTAGFPLPPQEAAPPCLCNASGELPTGDVTELGECSHRHRRPTPPERAGKLRIGVNPFAASKSDIGAEHDFVLHL